MLSEAQKRANEKWKNNNKERVNYLKDRSKAKAFIEKATLSDLEELKILINKKLEKSK